MRKISVAIYGLMLLSALAAVGARPVAALEAHCLIHCEVCRCHAELQFCDCDKCSIVCQPS